MVPRWSLRVARSHGPPHGPSIPSLSLGTLMAPRITGNPREKYRYRYFIDTRLILYRYSIDTISIQYRYCIVTVSIQYRYSIDTASILYRYSIDIACKNPKTGCFWGRKTEAQGSLGSENRSTGELWGRSWVASGGSWGDFGGQREVGGGRRRPKKKCSFPEV